MVDFANRWSPPFVQAKHAITSEQIGKVLYVDMHLNDAILVPTEMLGGQINLQCSGFLAVIH